MEPADYLRVIARRWPLLAACFLIGAIAAFITSPSRPQNANVPAASYYSATVTMMEAQGADKPLYSLDFIQLMATRGPLPERVAAKVHYEGDPLVMVSEVEFSPEPQLGVLNITSKSADGDAAANLVNAYADEINAFLQERETQRLQVAADQLNSRIQRLRPEADQAKAAVVAAGASATSSQTAEADVLSDQLQKALAEQTATENADPASVELEILRRATPVPANNATAFTAPTNRGERALIGALAAVLIGILITLVIERVDARLRSRSAVTETFQAPIVADVPALSRSARDGLVMLTDPESLAAQAYRGLRTTLQVHSGDQGAVILVVSAIAAEGKTSTVANLAAAFGEVGRRVLVIDLDHRNPQAQHLLEVPPGPGIAELGAEPSAPGLRSLARPTSAPKVRLLTGGAEGSAAVILPETLTQVVRECRTLADVILIDTSPLLSSADALDLLPLADQTLAVCRLGRTSVAQATRLSELLRRVDSPPDGVVVIGSGQPRTLSLPHLTPNSMTVRPGRKQKLGTPAEDTATIPQEIPATDPTAVRSG